MENRPMHIDDPLFGGQGNGISPLELIKLEHTPVVKDFHAYLRDGTTDFYLADQVRARLDEFSEQNPERDPSAISALRRLYRGCQEIILFGKFTYAMLRPKIGVKRLVRMHADSERFEEVTRDHYLHMKDAYVQGPELAARRGLILDFAPFFRDYPKVKEPREMGNGISLLNRHLSGKLYQNAEAFQRYMLRFLQDAHIGSKNLLVNSYLSTPDLFVRKVEEARDFLGDIGGDTPFEAIEHDLRVLGFEGGWGRDAGTIGQNLGLLAQVIESSDPALFERLMARLPLIHKVLMVSPHGWFAQEGVLGKPDTGGQVTYVLDQARALERQMKRHFADCGVDVLPQILILTRLIPADEGTTCGHPRERVFDSENCWIIRVPFVNELGEVVPDWISRFKIWPYLERFSGESKKVILREFMGKPDLIIGHYSDGNLVAHRLAEELGVTHCAAVHALEKTKYLFSDLHWTGMEHDYHFSLQFTADIIAYNSADYIISSSYREIGGTDTEMGMFESYESFSMPGLYRVSSGMDPKLARYNIVPPGASEEHFYPYTERERRVSEVSRRLSHMLFTAAPEAPHVGTLANPELPAIFAMSRLDKVKNLPGLVEAYGRSKSLRKAANLVILSSLTDAQQSRDQEEIETIHRLYELFHRYNLEGHMRWCAARLGKLETGEIYRVFADHGGVFAQPAFMETFGLTVIEAMSCGLPVVVTAFGGPAEIVVPGVSGEVQNPNDHEAFAGALERIVSDRTVWEAYSLGGIERVCESFNWRTHARRILELAHVYSYWNFMDVMNRQALDRYIHTLYHTVYRPRAEAMQ